MALSAQAAREILKPYEREVKECIVSAWDEYGKIPFRHKLTPRTRANVVHDFMVDNARKLEYRPGIRIHEINGLFIICIKDKLFIRFKKLDEDKLSHSIQTQQTLEFLGQEELPRFPVARLIAGYELNSLQTDLKAVTITYPSGSRNAWHYDLDSETTVTQVNPEAAVDETETNRFLIKSDEDAEAING